MTAVRVMQVSVDQIVDVIAMRHRLVPTAGTVLVPSLMPGALVLRRAAIGILGGNLDHMLIDMIAMHVMQVTVVQVIDMVAMLHCLVATAWSMLMRVICVMRIRTRRHGRLSLCEPSIIGRHATAVAPH